jgi:hypothetical protein
VWPYNFFAMTHGRSEAESDRRVRQVRDRMAEHWDVSGADWDTLFSTEILKKTGIRLEERADANTDGGIGDGTAESSEREGANASPGEAE